MSPEYRRNRDANANLQAWYQQRKSARRIWFSSLGEPVLAQFTGTPRRAA